MSEATLYKGCQTNGSNSFGDKSTIPKEVDFRLETDLGCSHALENVSGLLPGYLHPPHLSIVSILSQNDADSVDFATTSTESALRTAVSCEQGAPIPTIPQDEICFIPTIPQDGICFRHLLIL